MSVLSAEAVVFSIGSLGGFFQPRICGDAARSSADPSFCSMFAWSGFSLALFGLGGRSGSLVRSLLQSRSSSLFVYFRFLLRLRSRFFLRRTIGASSLSPESFVLRSYMLAVTLGRGISKQDLSLLFGLKPCVPCEGHYLD